MEIANFPRCADRKESYNIILAVYLVIFVALFAICGMMKRSQIKEKMERLQRLKINKIHEENVR